MSRKHIPTSEDFYKVKRQPQLTRSAKSALVKLYGILPVDCELGQQPYLSPEKWMDRLRISPILINVLYEQGMVERRQRPDLSWDIRLSDKGYKSIVKK